MNNFKFGDKVRFAAGGPLMMCGHYIEPMRGGCMTLGRPGGHFCRWMDTDGHLQENLFQPEELVAE